MAQGTEADEGRERPIAALTLRDVARRAGVSIATVSRVLNNQAHVADTLRWRVQQVILELGYVPNAAARALAAQRSRTIGVLVPTIEFPGFAITVEALQRCLSERGFTVLQATSNYDLAREFEQARVLTTRGVDGLMLIGARHNDALYEWLRAQNVAFITSWIWDPNSRAPCVGFSNRAAASQIASYLMDLGHTRIGVITGNTQFNDRTSERLEGVRGALAGRGLKICGTRLSDRPFKIIEGRYGLRALLEQPDPPTAIICSNDSIAFGAISEAHRMGLDVPGELSVVGFGDADFAEELTPPLTTMRVEAARIGVLAAEFLLDRIEGRPTLERIEVPVTMVVRQSTAPPKGLRTLKPRRRARGRS